MLFMLMFALTQNITNATLCVVLASMSTNVVELSFCVSVLKTVLFVGASEEIFATYSA